VLTGLFAFVALIIIIVAATAGGSPSSGTNTLAGTPADRLGTCRSGSPEGHPGSGSRADGHLRGQWVDR
jgi:hypothetical protein